MSAPWPAPRQPPICQPCICKPIRITPRKLPLFRQAGRAGIAIDTVLWWHSWLSIEECTRYAPRSRRVSAPARFRHLPSAALRKRVCNPLGHAAISPRPWKPPVHKLLYEKIPGKRFHSIFFHNSFYYLLFIFA